MKLILLADVKKVGRRHEVVDVANGYAQNILLPQKLALPATPDNIKRFQKEKGRADDKKAFDQTLIEKNIKDVDGKVFTIQVRANESGTLFQTIHPKNVLDVIKKELHLELPEQVVRMDDIKKVGEYEVKFASGALTAQATVKVVVS